MSKKKDLDIESIKTDEHLPRHNTGSAPDQQGKISGSSGDWFKQVYPKPKILFKVNRTSNMHAAGD